MSSMPGSRWSPRTGAVSPEWPGAIGFEERVRIFTKLFSIYPVSKMQNQQGRIAAFIEETQTIPCFFLRVALGHITKQPRDFAPSPGEIHAVAARSYAEIIRRGTGEEVYESSQRQLRSNLVEKLAPKLIHAMNAPQDPRIVNAAYAAVNAETPAGLITG